MLPHGIYDSQQNRGYITLGNSKDTREFACL
ncbi:MULTISPECIES: ISAzo13-like element transposase-related protein [unclassified Microcoleus]